MELRDYSTEELIQMLANAYVTLLATSSNGKADRCQKAIEIYELELKLRGEPIPNHSTLTNLGEVDGQVSI